MFEFQNLEVYKKAKVFHIACKTLLTQRKLDGYVRDQLGRASFSIALNIDEGSAKFSKPDRKNYLNHFCFYVEASTILHLSFI